MEDEEGATARGASRGAVRNARGVNLDVDVSRRGISVRTSN